jgi:hypothetical protein
MIRVRTEIGRLMSVFFRPPLTEAEADEFVLETRRIITAAPEPLVCFSDARSVAVLSPEIANKIVALMKTGNPRIERHGVLISGSAVFGLQAERMFREAGSPSRRAFRDVDTLVAWLSETLTAPEQLRLRACLEQPG